MQAYAQVSVDEASKKFMCINTHNIRDCTRIQSCPKIFHATTGKILQGVEKFVSMKMIVY